MHRRALPARAHIKELQLLVTHEHACIHNMHTNKDIVMQQQKDKATTTNTTSRTRAQPNPFTYPH
jgi:hypothetical protein